MINIANYYYYAQRQLYFSQCTIFIGVFDILHTAYYTIIIAHMPSFWFYPLDFAHCSVAFKLLFTIMFNECWIWMSFIVKWSQTQNMNTSGAKGLKQLNEKSISNACWILWSLSTCELIPLKTVDMTQYECLSMSTMMPTIAKHCLFVWLITNLCLFYMHDLFWNQWCEIILTQSA